MPPALCGGFFLPVVQRWGSRACLLAAAAMGEWCGEEFLRSTEALCFLQGPSERAEAWKADNAWPHPHETVRAKQQSARAGQKPDGPSTE